MWEYIRKYKGFLEEYRKYQVCLFGDVKDCQQMKELLDYSKVHNDFLRICAWQISPETMYLNMRLREKLKTETEGAVTGLSYEQREINLCKHWEESGLPGYAIAGFVFGLQ